jgi:chromosomal replication initiation ATPase DnaA
VVLDNADLADEVAFFHLYNHLWQQQVNLLFVSRQAPAFWKIELADLASRLRAAPLAELQAMDDTLLTQLWARQFAIRQLQVEPSVLSYLRTHAGRSYEAICQGAAWLDAAALAQGRGITIPLVREMLEKCPPDAGEGKG